MKRSTLFLGTAASLVLMVSLALAGGTGPVRGDISGRDAAWGCPGARTGMVGAEFRGRMQAFMGPDGAWGKMRQACLEAFGSQTR